MTHPPIKAPFELPQTEAAAVQAALRDLLDGIHAGRFVPVAAGSKGYCTSLVDAGESALAATQPSAAPGDGQGAGYHFTDGTFTLKQDVLDAIQVYAGSRPEEDPDEPETWESWFEAAFDLCSSRVHDIFDEHKRRGALAAPSAAIAAREQENDHYPMGDPDEYSEEEPDACEQEPKS